MTWSPEAEELLINQEYDQLVDFYENLIAENPEEISNYWYLGLAYLFQGKEEEAQTTWFIPFTFAEDQTSELWTEDLILTLKNEAKNLEQLETYKLVWLIRNAIKTLNPQDLENLLLLIKAAIILNYFQPNLIQDWNLIELLKQEKSQIIETKLLLEIISLVLLFPAQESINFAEAILIYTDKNREIINNIATIACEMRVKKGYAYYAIAIYKLLLNFVNYDLFIYKELYSAYLQISDYTKAIEIAEIIKINSSSREEKILANNFLIPAYLMRGESSKTQEIIEEQTNYWREITTTKYLFKNYLTKDNFISSSMYFLYVKDDLIYNRCLFNQIAEVFYNSNQRGKIINYPQKTNVNKLKIGYIGSTFRTHAVGFLCRWLISHHNSNLFDIYLYSLEKTQDAITDQWFKPPKVKQFYLGAGNIDQIVDQIQSDQIQILVDLDSITVDYTNLLLVQKPAPIQVTWLGLDASGLPTIDYYIADPYVLPNYAEEYYREKIWRLPNTYLAIDGCEVGISTLTREDLEIENNAIIYLSVQTACKRNPDNIRLQLKIIKQVENSYFLIQGNGDEESIKNLFKVIANEEGIEYNRLKFLPTYPTEIYRANLAIADVILDTYPFNGATTTLDALWLEIPIVTKVGQQFNARQGYTFLTNLGIKEGIAWSDEEYIQWGVKFGTDEELRKEVSWKLRQSKKTSPLWNGKQFTREMEKTYQQMWEIYLRTNK
jgi:predicted O-linked N-acetylglucosamine transferase (SPINDLY family)